MSGSDEHRDRDERPEGDAAPPEDPHHADDAPARGEGAPETGETSGLGLTDEFARIEAEIEQDLDPGESDPSGQQAEEPAPAPDVPEPAAGEPAQQAGAAEQGAEEPEGPAAEELDEPVADASDGTVAEGPEEPAAEPEETAPEAPADGTATEESEGPAAVDEPAAGGPEAPADEEPEPTSERDPATVLKAGTQPVRPRPQTAIPVAAGISEEELAVKAPSLWLRFLSGSVLIVASMAAAVAVTGLLFLSDVAAELQPIPGIQKQLAAVASDDPQTILIIGSDRRADTPKEDRRSDTTMLLRVDPDKEVLSLFSLPRDLKVDIPGFGPSKLNEAYTLGGEKLTLKTVKRFTGLDINHVVEINFSGFADAVNAIECVYIDLDREYFNVNDGSVENDYAEIDINAGYQRLCGLKALQYVRYRHTDTDLVRAARQQDFLREARQKVQPRELVPIIGGTGNELIDIFTDYTRSDIATAADVSGILKSFIAVRDVPVNEVHFEGDIGGPDDPFVTSTDQQVEKAIDEFLNGVGSEGQRGGEKANQKKRKKSDKEKKEDGGKDEPKANVVSTSDLGDAKYGSMAARLEADANKNVRRLGIPAFYATELVPGSQFSADSRTYEYDNEDDKREAAYKTVIALDSPDRLVEYYGFMGTTWDDPPILRNPSETREINGREYLLFYDGGRLRLVGWKEKGNSYWLNNTLSQSIGEPEMLAIATSIDKVKP